jgi:hypothetical protein
MGISWAAGRLAGALLCTVNVEQDAFYVPQVGHGCRHCSRGRDAFRPGCRRAALLPDGEKGPLDLLEAAQESVRGVHHGE